MRRRALAVLVGVLFTCLIPLIAPSPASASDCGGGGFRAGARASSNPEQTCNNYAVNAAQVVGGVAVAVVVGLTVLAYRRGRRANQAAMTAPLPTQPPPPTSTQLPTQPPPPTPTQLPTQPSAPPQVEPRSAPPAWPPTPPAAG